jgi:hypothetical protein
MQHRKNCDAAHGAAHIGYAGRDLPRLIEPRGAAYYLFPHLAPQMADRG